MIDNNSIMDMDEVDACKMDFRFKREPDINVISKEEFEIRVQKVFHLLWKTLSKSFGPYGAPTLILNYPFHHVTKDGYTIMKNLQMNASETFVDQAINNLCSDICGRLNYSVGDGTTTAVIATNSIYQNYMKVKDELNNSFILPRDVIYKYDIIKERIISHLNKYITPIKNDNIDLLAKNIYNVVFVSSNGDKVISDYITNLYKELKFPAITCELATDGITKSRIVEGYQLNLLLNDKLYINSDDNVMNLENADIIIFSIKVNKDIYEKILVPLNIQSKLRGRHLIVAAPYYDEMALGQVIRRDLNYEYNKTKDINMVLTTYQANSAHSRKIINDFSVLCNTMVIDKPMCQTIMDDLNNGNQINQIFNIDGRLIQGIKCLAVEDNTNKLVQYVYGIDTIPDGYHASDSAKHGETFYVDSNIPLGFVKRCSLGLKTSIFKDLVYDQERLNQIKHEAQIELEEVEAKYQKLGTFNIEVGLAQQRFYALNLKMGIIEVGADSELSQKLLKDSVDDAVRAAASAYNHGIILGCNTHMIKTIEEIINETTDEIDVTLLNILYEGFLDVYRTVLSNAFKDFDLLESGNELNIDDIINKLDKTFKKNISFDTNILEKVCKKIINKYGNISIHNLLIFYGLEIEKVFDIAKFEYSSLVVNSAQTDEEILKATIDLIALLIVGNQMVVTQRHNF